MSNRAVFLDRDNTLIYDPGFLSNPEEVHLIEKVTDGLKVLVNYGFMLVIVTNQSGVALGYFDESTVSAVNAEVLRQLSDASIPIEAAYYCPYHPEGTIEPFNKNHPDRKPNPGMLLRAAEDLNIDLGNSWMIGDSVHDSEAGKRASCRTIRIASLKTQVKMDVQWADYFCSDMIEAAKIIIANL